MVWHRLGFVWGPDGSQGWSRSHAANPFVISLNTDTVRVFFGTRADDNRSSVGWVDATLSATPGTAMRIIAVGDTPLLSPGAAGSFDDSGIGVGSIVRDAPDGDRLYFMGWNLGGTAPWRNSIGMANGDATLPGFHRPYEGPILDRSIEDPFTISYPWVLRLADDDWRMWYGSNTAWGASNADMQHMIKAAKSRDGIHWERSPIPILPFADPAEYAMARPCVVRDDDGFTMWFATRGDHYRIGAARSIDGERWDRCDDTHGLDRSGAGWDDAMTCYPCVFDHGSRRLMLYNGNAYGRAGFGLAEWRGAA